MNHTQCETCFYSITIRLVILIIDLHAHTYPASDDSNLTLPELTIQSKAKGLDGICITDHDRFLDTNIAKDMTEKYGILVIPGAEVTTDNGHVLIFGLTGYVFGMHNPAFLKNLVDNAGGAMIAAHPYRRAYLTGTPRQSNRYRRMVLDASTNPLYSTSDAIETGNGRGSVEENIFSEDVRAILGMNGVGSSDSHTSNDIGKYATEFHTQISDLYDLVSALKSGLFSKVSLGNTN